MAKGYWVARVDVSDTEKYKAYMTANAQPFRKYGARFLVRLRSGDLGRGLAILETILPAFGRPTQ